MKITVKNGSEYMCGVLDALKDTRIRNISLNAGDVSLLASLKEDELKKVFINLNKVMVGPQ